MDIRKLVCGGMEWVDVAQIGISVGALGNTVMNLLVS
jgi:hypothetical protein